MTDTKRIKPKGLYKVLVVFVVFQGDDFNDSQWPTNSLPVYAYQLLDSTATQNSADYSLSQYFKVMFKDSLKLIGKVFPSVVYTKHPMSYYTQNNLKYDSINIETLRTVDSINSIQRYFNFNIFELNLYYLQFYQY